jgi:hypothetical protein
MIGVLILVAVLGVAAAVAVEVPDAVDVAKQAAIAGTLAAHGAAAGVYTDCVRFWPYGVPYVSAGIVVYDAHDGPMTEKAHMQLFDEAWAPVDEIPVDAPPWSIWFEVWTAADAAGNQMIPQVATIVIGEELDADPPVGELLGCAN